MVKKFVFAEHPDMMILESGRKFGPITQAYETYGTMTNSKDNVVLVLHAFSGDAHVADSMDESGKVIPGWWNCLVGPGKGVDTEKYFVICINILGGCMGSTGPSSINPETEKPYGATFPFVTIGDMVYAQKKLLDSLGIKKVKAVIGGSVGGMQALQWSTKYPEMVESAILVATTMRHSALSISFNEIARQAIMSDPNWQNGNYYDKESPELGLKIARMVGHVTYLSDEAMKNKFGRKLQNRQDLSYDFETDFQVESYLSYQGKKFVERFDANSLLYITRAADYFDLTDGNKKNAMNNLFGEQVKFLVVSYSSDWLYPTYQSKEIVRALKQQGQDVSFCEIEADCGHDAFLLPNDRVSKLFAGFLEKVSS